MAFRHDGWKGSRPASLAPRVASDAPQKHSCRQSRRGEPNRPYRTPGRYELPRTPVRGLLTTGRKSGIGGFASSTCWSRTRCIHVTLRQVKFAPTVCRSEGRRISERVVPLARRCSVCSLPYRTVRCGVVSAGRPERHFERTMSYRDSRRIDRRSFRIGTTVDRLANYLETDIFPISFPIGVEYPRMIRSDLSCPTTHILR